MSPGERQTLIELTRPRTWVNADPDPNLSHLPHPVVRTDSLKGRRGRLPSKPKAAQDVTPAVSPVGMMASLVRAHIESNPGVGLDYSQVGNVLQPMFRHEFHAHVTLPLQYDDSEGTGSRREDAADVRRFYQLLAASMDVVRRWARSIPGFSEFCSEDQELLLESAFVELFVLRLAYR